MPHAETKHTIDIFERIYSQLPPLLPPEIKFEFEHALEHLHDDVTVDTNDVENIVISLGKKVWPYRRAFGEFLDMHQGKLGEKFLLGKLPVALKGKIKELKEQGVTYHDLRVGGPAEYFEIEERMILQEKLIEVDSDIKSHAVQAVLGIDRKKYESLIVDFQMILDDIEKRLETFRSMAEDEEEHPRLADEIRAQVRSFEFGLCLLGPNTELVHVINAHEHFAERKIAKKLHRME
ncbi:MAG: hypothetical protein WAV48_00690 [Candidatus Magasanikiibacteriota bacterium]